MKNLIFVVLSFFTLSCCSLDDISKIGNYDNPKKALMVVDMQIDYIDENGKFPIEKNQINNLITNTNYVIDDFFINGYEIIYIKMYFRKNDIKNVFRNFAVIEGSAGAEIDPRINIRSNNIFTKYTPNAFTNNRLENYLIKNQINEIFMCGVMADECVYETALGAFDRGYIVNYISNAVGSSSIKNIEDAIEKLRKKGINIIEY